MSRRWSCGVIAVVGLVGCVAEETTLFEDNPALTPKGTECSLDPDCGEPVWRPQWFTMSATFAIDPTASTLRSYRQNGVEVLPHMVFRLTHELVPTECVVTLTLEHPGDVAIEAWSWEDPDHRAANQEMSHVGFFLPDDVSATSEGCEWVDALGFGEPAENVAKVEWGFGVGTLRVDVQRMLDSGEANAPDFEDEHVRGNVSGGSWSANVWAPSTWASHAAVVSRLDEAGEHAVDASGWPSDIVSAKALAAGAPFPGRYHVQTVYEFDGSYLSR